MDKAEIDAEHKRITTNSSFKRETVVPEKEEDVAKRAAKMTRRQRATRIVGGKTRDGREYLLLKFRNNMI